MPGSDVLQDRATPHQGPRHLSDAGSASVEGVIIAPIMLLATLLIIQAGFYYMTSATVGNAAQLAVERARTEAGTDQSGQAAARDYLNRAGEDTAQIQISRTATEVTATVTTPAPSLLPGGLLPDVEVVAVGPVERVTP